MILPDRQRKAGKRIDYALSLLRIFRCLLWITTILYGMFSVILFLAVFVFHLPKPNFAGYSHKDLISGFIAIFSDFLRYVLLLISVKIFTKIIISIKNERLFREDNRKRSYNILVLGILYIIIPFFGNSLPIDGPVNYLSISWGGIFFELQSIALQIGVLYTAVWLFDLGAQIQSEMDEVI